MESTLELLVYFQPLPRGLAGKQLPGIALERHLEGLNDPVQIRLFDSRLKHCCRKFTMVCLAAERAKSAEREFYSETIKESPTLFGYHAAEICYHLEAFIMIGRSSLDLSAAIFSELLLGKRLDSFNDFTKALARGDLRGPFADLLALKEMEESWLALLCGSERGRALRDKVAHQTGFPIDYEELMLESEKESAVVRISRSLKKPLPLFLDEVRDGIIASFRSFEDYVAANPIRSGQQ